MIELYENIICFFPVLLFYDLCCGRGNFRGFCSYVLNIFVLFQDLKVSLTSLVRNFKFCHLDFDLNIYI